MSSDRSFIPSCHSRSSGFHVVFIRHGESSNNVISSQLQRELEASGTFSPHEFRRLYDTKRSPDPSLSLLGHVQADRLLAHPHLIQLPLIQLAKENRISFICSPLTRNIETSLPLIRLSHSFGHSVRGTILSDFCEKGGFYYPPAPLQQGEREQNQTKNEKKKYPNHRALGHGREYFSSCYGSTHDCDEIAMDGWWNLDHPEEEQQEEFEKRLERIGNKIIKQANSYWTAYETCLSSLSSFTCRDYLFIISHGDLMDQVTRKLLQIPKQAKVEFHYANTGIAHFELVRNRENQKQTDELTFDEQLKSIMVYTHAINAKPAEIEANEPQADE
jgi:broad specificity phosphatase PhoE